MIHTKIALKQKNCIFVIQNSISVITYQTIKRQYLKMRFIDDNLKNEQIFIKVDVDVKKQNYLMLKIESIIQQRVAEQHHTLLISKNAEQM